MTFIYKDNRGTAYSFSGSKLKKDLLLLQNKNEESLPGVLLENDDLNTGDQTDTENLKDLYAKLNFEVTEITNADLISKFSLELNPNNLDLFSSIFALNKIHFRAVIYLLYTNQINIDYIKILLDADLFTRNKLIISKFPEYENKNLMISKLTETILPSYFSEGSQISSMKINESKEFSIVDISAFMFPEHYYLLKNTFFSDSFQNIVWEKNNFNQIVLAKETKETKYITSNPDNKIRTQVIQDLGASGVLTYYRSMLEAISNSPVRPSTPIYYYRKSNNSSELRSISSENLFSYLLNSDFMEWSRLSAIGKLNYGNKDASDFTRNRNRRIILSNGLKRSLNYAISDNANKPKILSMFHHMYFMYNNESNYLTLENFNFDSINTNFDITDTSILNSMYDFSYITNNEPFKNFLIRLFPNFISPDENKLPSYAYRYFLNRPAFGVLPNSPTPPPTSYVKLRFNLIENVYKNITVIKDDKTVEKIGGSDIKAYFDAAISLAFQSIENSPSSQSLLDVLDYDSFNLTGVKAVESLNTIKNAVIAHINSQTAVTNGYVNQVTLIYRGFLIDLITSYFEFLTDPSKTIFNYKVSEENFKVYKLLNFTKHIFINLYDFIRDARVSKPLLDFYTMLLSIKGLLRKEEIKDIINNTKTI
jgi:hypothetical protein